MTIHHAARRPCPIAASGKRKVPSMNSENSSPKDSPPPVTNHKNVPVMVERRTALRLLTLQEVARFCRVPLSTVRFWRTMGKIKVIKPGRHPLVLASHLFEFLGITDAAIKPENRA